MPTVLVDGGAWHGIHGSSTDWGCHWWERVTFGKRDAVEQQFLIFKQRIRQFTSGVAQCACGNGSIVV